MRLCSYVVVHDFGFSPNPFGGYCTLAACTPNHQGIRLAPGDWLLGNSTAATGNLLVYAMRVSEVLDFDDYYQDPRFQTKKPRGATWEDRCGDNIYYRDDEGEWRQGKAFYHTEPERVGKDTKHPRVFISDHFYYFGENAPPLPAEFGSLIRRSQGCACTGSKETVLGFVAWLGSTHEPGIRGLPRDNPERGTRTTKLVQLGSERRVRQGRG